MKNLIAIGLLLLIGTTAYSQDESANAGKKEFFIKAGLGTSWVLLPKVFLIDETDPTNNWQILPATNAFTGYVGFQPVFGLGNRWALAPELNINYVSGEIRVDEFRNRRTAQNLQNYWRLEVPLNIAVFSKDNFWVSFGPSIFFTLYDNKGFDNTVYELTTNPTLDSSRPIGARFRLAIYAPVGDRAYIDIKFESDLGQYFKYENDTYKANFSFQNICVGFGWNVKKE